MIPYLSQYQKSPVTAYATEVSNNPVVSVCIQTYNQVDHIRECLDSIISQKTSFPFEILLGEDESQDGTRKICIEYAEKYPDLIRLFLHSRDNNIAIEGTPTGRFNFLYNIFSASGKYLAVCEGDDYWVDPLKLQKQFDFMEANSQCSMLHTNYLILAPSGDQSNYRSGTLPKFWPSPEQLLLNNYIGTLTAFTKRSNIMEILENDGGQNFRWPMLDYYLWLKLSRMGPLGFLNDKTALYRKQEGSLSAFGDEQRHSKFLDSVKDMQVTLIKEFENGKNFDSLSESLELIYNRKRFRLAVEVGNARNARKYYWRMKFITRLNPVNLLKLIKVHF